MKSTKWIKFPKLNKAVGRSFTKIFCIYPRGFTLLEVLMVIGLFTVLITFVAANLIRPQTQASAINAVNSIVAELRQQQFKSMMGDASGFSAPQSYGVAFSQSSYTLLPENKIFNLEGNIEITQVRLPSNRVTFLRRSGEVSGFNEGSNSFMVRDKFTGEQVRITINKYGVILIN